MPDDPPSRTYELRRLCCSLRFRSYSDAKLAGLLLDNNFPIVLFKKVLDVILDPAFKSEDVTYEDVWDILVYVSTRRRKGASKRELAPTAIMRPGADSEEVIQIRTPPPTSGVVPPLVLDLVVDRLIKDRQPLNVAATSSIYWPEPFQRNIEPFHNMSLVHRSWTSIAQRGMRYRVVVPYQYIEEFLLSPFCGPWINEMIIYWTVDNGMVGITKGDIWLLEALLERTPNLQSLFFHTSLIWPEAFTQPLFNVDICLEIISDLLPDLEYLWLRHSAIRRPPGERTLETCMDMRSLYRQIPKLRSLKFLSLHAWGTNVHGEESVHIQDNLDWKSHPPPQLKEIELSYPEGISQEDLSWLLKPREQYCLQSMSVTVRYSTAPRQAVERESLQATLRDCLPRLNNLRLCIIGAPAGADRREPFYSDLLLSGTSLVSLELFIVYDWTFDLGTIHFPPCLERLALHLCYNGQRANYKVANLVRASKMQLASLPRLRSLLIFASQSLRPEPSMDWSMNGFSNRILTAAMPFQDRSAEDLHAFCKERSISLSVMMNDIFETNWEADEY